MITMKTLANEINLEKEKLVNFHPPISAPNLRNDPHRPDSVADNPMCGQ